MMAYRTLRNQIPALLGALIVCLGTFLPLRNERTLLVCHVTGQKTLVPVTGESASLDGCCHEDASGEEGAVRPHLSKAACCDLCSATERPVVFATVGHALTSEMALLPQSAATPLPLISAAPAQTRLPEVVQFRGPPPHRRPSPRAPPVFS